MSGTVRVRAWPDALVGPPVDFEVAHGATIAELVAAIPLSAEMEPRRALMEVTLGGHVIPTDRWHRVRPAAYLSSRPVAVAVRLPMRDGGGQGGSSSSKVLATIATLALVAATMWIGGGGLAFALGSSFAAGTTGATLLAAGVSIAGSLAIQGLLAASAPKPPKQDPTDWLGQASAQNSFRPGEPLPRVMGRAKVYPPMVVPPFTQLDVDRKRSDNSLVTGQYVTFVCALAGRHEIDTIYLGDREIDAIPDIEYEVRNGTSGDTALTLVEDTRIEEQLGEQLSEWETKQDALDEGSVKILGTEEEAAPKWHRVQTKVAPDSFRIEFLLSGLAYTFPTNDVLDKKRAGVALRIRMRRRKTDGWYSWVNLPELIITGYEPNNGLRLHLEIHWVSSYPAGTGNTWPQPVDAGGFTTGVDQKVKGWTKATTRSNWRSSLLTVMGLGFRQWNYGEQKLKLYLLKTAYPQGIYQFEIMRGYPFQIADFSMTGATYKGETDLFAAPTTVSGTPALYRRPSDFLDDVTISSVQSIWNQYPISAGGQPCTLIAVRAKNRQLGPLSVIAAGVIDDYVSGSWTAGRTTSNPASWWRHVLMGIHTLHPVPSGLIDMANVQDWHAWCKTQGLEINAAVAGESLQDVLRMIALAGLGSPHDVPQYGVVIERKRDAPVALVTSRNAGAMEWSRAFADPLHGLRVSFEDRSIGYAPREITVYAPGYSASNATAFEAVTYKGLVTEAQARRRALLDLAWRVYRSTFYSWTADVEALEYRRGDLILLETDILGTQVSRARVVEVITSGSNVTGLVVDEDISYGAAIGDLWKLADLGAPADLQDVDTVSAGVVIRLTNGQILTKGVAASTPGRSISFDTPFSSSGVAVGCLVVAGEMTKLTREVIVWDIAPGPDLTARITAVDYADDQMY